jgi:FAD/FMN-containing dehydrogenase
MLLIIPISLFLIALLAKKVIDLSSAMKGHKDLFPNIRNETKQLEGESSGLPFSQLGGTINDASGINRTAIYGIIEVKTEEDIKNCLLFAKKNGLKISIAGAKHSMGGQAFATNTLVLNMLHFNNMSLDSENKVLTVQSGAIWHDIQNYLNKYHLSVQAMQSIDILTVGGTIAVNAHGMDHRIGGIARTVKSIWLMLADGSIERVSMNHNEELFKAVIGGYGLLGVILDVQLELMENLIYVGEQKIVNIHNLQEEITKIEKDKNYHMFYARLSTAPSSFLREVIIYTFRTDSSVQKTIEPLKLEGYIRLKRFIFNLGRRSYLGRELKWQSEKYILPLVQKKFQSRNQIMHRSYAYIKNNFRDNTDVLQEYFIPKQQLRQFIKGLKEVLKKNNVITRNVEIRCVCKEDILLDYASGDWFGVVLYLNLNITEKELQNIREVHLELINLAQSLGGSFYLPYQLNATKEQIRISYPNFERFWELKKKYDPDSLFTSKFYGKIWIDIHRMN